ncbi:MAG: gliding motility-associated C-terminal domain-containing protein, partial [Elusimicrobia bacterium]|nr:gliding motility-associated C-terminal domain-containing protein [Candidatus Obscuribacterium magneticum]
DGTPITDLAGYYVYRRSTLTGTPVRLTPLPLQVTVFADQVDGQTYYYTIRAVDNTDNESVESLIADSSRLVNIIFFATDGLSSVTMPERVNDLLRSAHNKYGVPLTVRMREEPIPAATEIVRNVRLCLVRGDTKAELNDLAFAEPQSIVAVGYNVVDGHVARGTPLQAMSPSVTEALPNQLSLYWHNGVTWVKVGGTVDQAAQALKIKSSFLGNYQIRISERSTSLHLDQANVYPRVFTPNGDGFNDRVYFILENPNDTNVRGEILDMAGRNVAVLPPPTTTSGIGSTLIWDGKDSSGNVVPSGLYIYRITGEGKTFTGTVAVAR